MLMSTTDPNAPGRCRTEESRLVAVGQERGSPLWTSSEPWQLQFRLVVGEQLS